MRVRLHVQLFFAPSFTLFFCIAPHCNAAFEHTEVLHHHSFFLHTDMVDVYSDSRVNELSKRLSKEYLRSQTHL